MGFLDSVGSFLDSASDFATDIGSIVNTVNTFGDSASDGAAPSFPPWFPPIFLPPVGGAPTAPPVSVAATPGGFLSGASAPLLIGGAIVLVLVLKR